MHFVSLTLQRPSAIIKAIYGHFSNAKAHEIVVAKRGAIELLRPDEVTGKLVSVSVTPVFATIRTLAPFRLTGSNKDYLVIGSDAGAVTVAEFSAERNTFVKVHTEIFGKTGCRRAVPGQYVACDPKGRAIMIAAVEKQKMVYVMNRDNANNLTISSPLEAHKVCTIAFDVVALDVGFDNPIFAVLELEYAEADQDSSGDAMEETEKMLTYYELDLGLNHVTRRWSEPVSRTANLLVPVPGGAEGPSGVLVLGENWVAYKHEGHAEVRAPVPRRAGYPAERGLLITCATTHKQKDLFFFLIQSEVGDLYKVTLDWSRGGGGGDGGVAGNATVRDVKISVFDLIFAAASLCITRTGLLFAAAEFGDHALFQFQGIGDEGGAGTARAVHDPELGDDSVSAAKVAPTFEVDPKRGLQNLLLIDEPSSTCAMTDLLAKDLSLEDPTTAGAASGGPQLYTLCGRGARSSLRVLRHGIAVAEMAVSELPGRPSAVWTVREAHGSETPRDRYIVVSFTNATLVLSIGETVEEVTDSGFLATAPTLDVALLADNALLQIHQNGIRHIRPDMRINEWKTPGKKYIEHATCNERQVAISLAGGEVIYFELDASGMLSELATKELGVEVSCIDVGPVPAGRARFGFLAIGGWDGSLRLLSLDAAELLVQVSTIQLGGRAESLRFLDKSIAAGLENGVLQTAAVDELSGGLSDARARFLGAKAVKLFRVQVRGLPGLLALSSRSWLCYQHLGKTAMAPLSYDALDFGCGFCSAQCPEGVVAIAGATLRIFVVEKLGETFNETKHALRYTPRRLMQIMPDSNRLLILEADPHQYTQAEKAALKAAAAALQAGDDMDTEDDDNNNSLPQNDDDGEAPENSVILQGPTPPADGKWASCVRIVDPAAPNPAGSGPAVPATVELVELGDSEAALSCAACTFAGRGGEVFVAVGTVKALTFHPRAHQGCFVHVYRLLQGERLVLLHKTPVEDVPLALVPFRGRLLVAMGPHLRVYDLGKRKLLRKTEAKLVPNLITKLEVMGDRIYAADSTDSIHYAKFLRDQNKIAVFADDIVSRCASAFVVLDYDTVCVADKFGNLAVLRLPDDASDDHGADPTGNLWEQGVPNKLTTLANFHVGDIVTQLRKTALAQGGAEAIVYVTISGAIGALIASTSKDDKDFFAHLEMHMRQEQESLVGRDHIQFRSYFYPVKDVADGDLCAEFANLPYDKQKAIASDLDRTPGEVAKKLEDTWNRLL